MVNNKRKEQYNISDMFRDSYDETYMIISYSSIIVMWQGVIGVYQRVACETKNNRWHTKMNYTCLFCLFRIVYACVYCLFVCHQFFQFITCINEETK